MAEQGIQCGCQCHDFAAVSHIMPYCERTGELRNPEAAPASVSRPAIGGAEQDGLVHVHVNFTIGAPRRNVLTLTPSAAEHLAQVLLSSANIARHSGDWAVAGDGMQAEGAIIYDAAAGDNQGELARVDLVPTEQQEESNQMPGLAAYRRRAGLTQRELAEKAHVASSTIEEIEMGKRLSIQTRTMDRLLAALGYATTPESRLMVDEFKASIQLPPRRRGPPKPRVRA